MNKMMVVAGAGMALLGTIGCLSEKELHVKNDGCIARIKEWKSDRAPVAVLKSSIDDLNDPDIKLLKVAIETADVAPYALYLGVTKLLDTMAGTTAASAQVNALLAYYNDAVKDGKSDAEAKEIAADKLKASEGDGVFAMIGEYKKNLSGMDLDAIKRDIDGFSGQVAAVQTAANGDSKALVAKGKALAAKLGMVKGAQLTKQVATDVGVISGQLKDTTVALGFCTELSARYAADKALIVVNAGNAAIIDGIVAVQTAGQKGNKETDV